MLKSQRKAIYWHLMINKTSEYTKYCTAFSQLNRFNKKTYKNPDTYIYMYPGV